MQREPHRSTGTARAVASPETQRKVVIRYANGKLLKAYLNASDETMLQTDDNQSIPVQTLQGRAVEVDPSEIKAIFIVKSFEGARDYSEFKVFSSRPGGQGVWLHVHFCDGEALEGVAPNNLRTFTSPVFCMSPADPASNNQVVLVSKRFLKDMHVLGLASD